MTSLSALVALCNGLESTRSRLAKLELVANFLTALRPEEAAGAVAFLTGRAFSASDPRVLGVRDLPATEPAATSSLTLADVDEAFAAVAKSTGAGSRRLREERLAALAARATGPEQAWLRRIIGGEMRTGVSDGLVLEAIGRAAGAEPAVVRRAALFLGDLSAGRRPGAGGAAPRPSQEPRPGSSCRCRRCSPSPPRTGVRSWPPTADGPGSSTSTTGRASSSTPTASAWRSGRAVCPT